MKTKSKPQGPKQTFRQHQGRDQTLGAAGEKKGTAEENPSTAAYRDI